MTFLALPGVTQTIIVVLLVVLLFGARRLPDLARALGSSVSQFKKGLKDGSDDADPLEPDAQARLSAGKPVHSDAARVAERDRA